MKPTFTFLLIFVFCAFISSAQGVFSVSGNARGSAVGGAGLGFSGAYALPYNQAGIAESEGTSANASAERRFLLESINGLSASAVLPTKSGSFGLSMRYFGFEDYNEQLIGLAYARKLLDRLSLGAQIDYVNLTIPEYGNQSTFTFEIGAQLRLSKSLLLGVHTTNPVRAKIIEDEPLPTILKTGLAYQPTDQVQLFAEVEKWLDYEARFRGGIEYAPVRQVMIRTGIATNPVESAFGLGYALNDMLFFDFSATYRQLLGFTPGFGIVFKSKK